MTTLQLFDDLQVPCYALPYLINGDFSGLAEEDIKAIDTWYAYYANLAAKMGGSVIFENDSDSTYFTSVPEFGLPCECVDCTILIVK